MAFSKYRILIYSENPDTLVKFYEDVLELKRIDQLSLPDDYGYMLQVAGDQYLWIGRHSEVKGKAKENFRHFVQSVSR